MGEPNAVYLTAVAQNSVRATARYIKFAIKAHDVVNPAVLSLARPSRRMLASSTRPLLHLTSKLRQCRATFGSGSAPDNPFAQRPRGS
jgi:hypothetical protein